MDENNTINENSETNELHETKEVPIAEKSERKKFSFKSRKSILITVILLLVIGAGLFLFLNKDSTDSATPQNSTTDESAQESTEQKVIVPYPKAGILSSINQNGNKFQLVNSDYVILERSQYEWPLIRVWGDWIFFSSQEKKNEYEPADTVEIHAYNFKTDTYKKIADITSESTIYGISQIDIKNDYLYVGFDGYRATGSIHRCELDSEFGCSEFNLITDKEGTFSVLDDNTLVIMNLFGDAEVASGAFNLFNLATKSESKITTYDSLYGVGTTYTGFAADNVFWFYEQDGDTSRGGETDFKPTLKRIYSVSTNGEELEVFDNEIPIDNAYVSYKNGMELHEIYIINDTQEVTFDTKTKKFSDVTPITETPIQSNTPDYSDDFIESLDLPEGFEIIKSENQGTRIPRY